MLAAWGFQFLHILDNTFFSRQCWEANPKPCIFLASTLPYFNSYLSGYDVATHFF
jgi:hypothetical protein